MKYLYSALLATVIAGPALADSHSMGDAEAGDDAEAVVPCRDGRYGQRSAVHPTTRTHPHRSGGAFGNRKRKPREV